ncbi:SUKH-4 family immunity protein [Streptomyces sp. NPDC051561]|uniref:SUKH-4 family immunity protein n=1 Tax=Streptomyces sp. NPDC051561 TaxID=3365658 RepID=UPI003791982B
MGAHMLVDFGREELGGVLAEAGVTRTDEASLEAVSGLWHHGTRRFLTEVGLPCEAPLMRFDLDGELRRRDGALEIGHFTFFPGGMHIVVRPMTGQVYVDDAGTRSLLASDLSSLVHLCELVALLDPNEGRYARHRTPCGPGTVAGIQRSMLELVGDTDPALLDTAEDIHPYWRTAMTVRALAWIAGPGEDGLAFDLSSGFLEDEFGPQEIQRYEDEALPALLTHEPTRRFLRTHGIVRDAGPLVPRQDPVPWADEGRGLDSPPRAGRMVDFGHIIEDTDLLIEGDTGRLHGWHSDSVLRQVNSDVSALAFTSWVFPQIRRLDALHQFAERHHEMAAATFDALLASVDPFAVDGPAERVGEGADEANEEDDERWGVWSQFADDEVLQAMNAPWTTDEAPLRVGYDRQRAEATYDPEDLIRADDLPAGIGHGPSRTFLTEVGLPREAPLLRFGPDLAEILPGLFRLGHLPYRQHSPYVVVLEGGTGRVWIGQLPSRQDQFDLHHRELFASDLSTLAYLTEALTRMRPDTGPYARDRVVCGPEVVAGLQQAMREVIRECDPRLLQVDDGVSAFWRHMTLIRPLLWIAGPGPDGLAFDLRAQELGAQLSHPNAFVAAYTQDDLPGVLTHAPTRRYLQETGLAHHGTAFIEPDTGRLPTVAELYDTDYGDPESAFEVDHGYDAEYYPRPPDAEKLLRLAYLAEDRAMLMEAATGRLYVRDMDSGLEGPMNADLSAYNFCHWMTSRIGELHQEGHLEGPYRALLEAALDTLATVDPQACAQSGDSYPFWPNYLGEDQITPLTGRTGSPTG